MDDINVHLSENSYSVYFLNTFDELSRLDSLLVGYAKILIITDTNVAPIYLSVLENYYKNKKCECFSLVFQSGEQAKNINNVMDAISFMADNNFHRNDLIIALGGGVIGDLSGFIASIYMRGINFIQIPTTLLASVDASIGGKTAIDIQQGKNIVGSFHQPKGVIQIFSVFEQLKKDIFLEGISEVIKYGAICDTHIFDLLKGGKCKDLKQVIYKCVNAKAEVVSKDEKESGLRKILNFGHTFGHSIEQASNYKISHGCAVAYGMLFESFLSLKIGHCDSAFCNAITNLINSWFTLPKLHFSCELLVSAMLKDKKNTDDRVSFVLPNGKDNKEVKLSVGELKHYLDEYYLLMQ